MDRLSGLAQRFRRRRASTPDSSGAPLTDPAADQPAFLDGSGIGELVREGESKLPAEDANVWFVHPRLIKKELQEEVGAVRFFFSLSEIGRAHV